MKVKEAEKVFSISRREIYELGRLGWSGIVKNGREWIVPDDTEVLLSVEDIRLFLYHILRYKINEGYVFPRKICPDDSILKIIINQQYKNGLIGNLATAGDFDLILKNIELTDEAIDLIIGSTRSKSLKSNIDVKINLNPTISVGVVNASASI